ncbi:MAG: ATP-binding protein [Firmicutes bacterium]|nr:ATP-binding protein [Bacillota bacterium]
MKKWLKSASALSNTAGGALLFGITDDGEIIGLALLCLGFFKSLSFKF